MLYPVVRRRLFSVLANNLKMPTYTGSCTCHKIEYNLTLNSPDDARTSLCHCKNCKKAFGTNYGPTAKVPKDALQLAKGSCERTVSVCGRRLLGRPGGIVAQGGVLLPDSGELDARDTYGIKSA
ncbi:hypothetical protein AN3314.2 [Aspergillus nidulans FGSC A4]|uniref:CENP-V/GFA domain-containing protein n=1 Tax=Emericella nidulans (strain FGSC A4 / ATCC 38163 / CBS 112.46 / NRRL 194 / M139) TaxID=227321 RepID=Q5B816_EMENI|nr:hypothetical protein [Aspergillus nidulans FGSC A4]EAA63282.1 hypothetical protein AN3314.2 [Aspergillus nidulans FGSC A4]CBF82973.1 TPA: conserved hypothetical protein [Aspergillus nidulans FGSC A4]|eukprot:XP_660918.1 hypothetical protein AN3314.2 [Aspergillus nidulans FGSC A4]